MKKRDIRLTEGRPDDTEQEEQESENPGGG